MMKIAKLTASIFNASMPVHTPNISPASVIMKIIPASRSNRIAEKKENIGLIEVMGLAVLPSRLKSEMEQLADAILEGKDIRSNEVLEKHADWVEEFLPKYTDITKENIMDILHEEIGQVFNQVLEDAGVYKQTEEGRAAFERFIGSL